MRSDINDALKHSEETASAPADATPWLEVELSELRSKPSIATTKTLADSLSPILKDDIGNSNHDQPLSCVKEAVHVAGSEHHTLKFWLVFAAFCMTSLLGGLDSTAMSTALATISSDIGGQEHYVWFANVGTITMTAVQPLFGQLANIFGRRSVTLFAIGVFIVGSGISGGAINSGMLISGRAIQGVGSGALLMLQDLIVCDLVPLRQRAKYIGIYTASAGVAASLGPLIGGAIAEWNWRWIFYINLPIGGLAFVAVALLLNTKYTRSPSWIHALLRIDYVGNIIFIAAVVSLLLGVVVGGQDAQAWSSWHVILPLILGVLGLAAFMLYETTPACKEPTIPMKLFGNRTSSIAFVLTFCSGMLLQWITYFLPIFFQGVQLATPIQSGVNIMPLNVALIVMAIVGGILISATGKFVPLHMASFAFLAVALGLFTRFDQNTKAVEWVFLQLLAGSGLGLTMNSPLTAVQASLPDTLNAAATATFGVIHTLAFTWGVTIPAVVFNAQIATNSWQVNLTAATRTELGNGRALGFTTRALLMSIPDVMERERVISLFTNAIKMTWYASVGVALLGLLLCFGEKQVELRTTVENNDFGMQEDQQTCDKV